MITVKEIDKLLSLARMEISEKEKEKLRKDIGSILGYIDQLKEASAVSPKAEKHIVRNVFRDDAISKDESCANDLIKAAPESKGGYVKVKKIL